MTITKFLLLVFYKLSIEEVEQFASWPNDWLEIRISLNKK